MMIKAAIILLDIACHVRGTDKSRYSWFAMPQNAMLYLYHFFHVENIKDDPFHLHANQQLHGGVPSIVLTTVLLLYYNISCLHPTGAHPSLEYHGTPFSFACKPSIAWAPVLLLCCDISCLHPKGVQPTPKHQRFVFHTTGHNPNWGRFYVVGRSM